MKQNSTRKKAAKRSELEQIDPLDDLDVRQLQLVARGRGWGTNSELGKRRARNLTVPSDSAKQPGRKRRRA
jgi:hypothetical protein